jgi:class 3 adenylate cyclase/tetratricopeptide (TPR) repeat protein
VTCASCGASSRANARFCEECGARLEATCPSCGARLAPGKKFCGDCGAPLGAPPPPAGPPEDARFAAPSGYTPPHLAERILRDRAALQGERKQVTVLFADVSGFTSLAEALDPEEVHALMNRAFELMLAAVHRYEGTVNQFLGDGLMALFGAPVALEDHARRAALAALAMQDALEAYREDLRRRRRIDFRVRMGLNTGLVVVAAIGDNLRMDYTAVGDTTNVAARMQQMAEPGQVVVADATRQLVEPYFHLQSLGPAHLKNRAEAVPAWMLGRPRPTPEARPLTPLLGRAGPLGALERAWAAARDGRGQAVYVVGEPGIGKSRLLLELRHRIGREATWLEGQCLSFGQATAFLPIADALRQGFGITEADTESAIVEKVTRSLAAHGERAAGIAPYIRYALSVDPGDGGVAAMDPTERRARMFRALHQLIRLSSLRRPVVLVVEDLHWIDSASEDYLAAQSDELAGLPLLLVLTWRPSYRPRFPEHTYVSRAVLEPLGEADGLRLVGAALRSEALPPELSALIARKAEGNPFFLEELARAFLDTGAVRREGERLVLARPLSAIEVPRRVQDVIAARIDRLGDDQKRTVQVASVIGREFGLRLLRRVAEATDRLERALADLKSLEFVYEKAAFGDVEYVFKHALTQDVAYESILQARRRELHARIGAGMEELYADRLDERADELAHHFTRGEVWLRAARYCRQAGDRAAALCVDAKAVELYERALDALGRLPETPETARLGIEARLALRAPLWRGGHPDRLFALFQEAEQLAARHDLGDRLDTIYAFLVQYHWAKGEQDEALAYGRRCLERAEAGGELALRVIGLFYLSHAHHAVGEFAQAVARARELMALLEGPRAGERFGLSGLPYSGACAEAALCLSELGDHAEASALIEQGARVAEAAGHLYSKAVLDQALGETLTSAGRPAEAIERLEETARICREKGFLGQLINALRQLGRAYVAAGRPAEALAPVRESIELQEKARVWVTRPLMHVTLARAHLALGELDQAGAELETARELAHRYGERSALGWADAVAGELARRRGDRPAAARHLEAARAQAETLGMRPLAARCLEELRALD